MVEDEKKNWMSCLGWGCVTVLVLSLLGVGGCVFVAYRVSSAPRTVAEGYLEMVAEGRWEDAYQKLGPVFTQDHDVGELVVFEQETRHELGPCSSWRPAGFSLNRSEARSIATVVYLLRCDSGEKEVVFSVEDTDRGWLIQGLRYRDPGAAPFPTCSECDGLLPPGSRFCPYCGAAVTGVEAPAAEESGTGEANE